MRKNKARFIKAGVTKYGNSFIFIAPETIAAAHKKIVGKPVYQDHNYNEKPRGEVLSCEVEHDWMVGSFTSKEKYKKVSVGYDAKKIPNYSKKKYDNIEYDYEMIDLKPYELSGITNNKQRYTGADVYETRIVNSTGEHIEDLSGVDNDFVRVYNCVDVDESVEENFNKKEKGSRMFELFRKEKVEEISMDSIVRVKNSAGEEVEMSLDELQSTPAKLEEANKKIAELEGTVEKLNSAEHKITIDDKEYSKSDVEALIEKADADVELKVGEKTYSKEELEEIVKEATQNDENIKNSVESSKELQGIAKEQHDKVLESLKKIK